MSKYRNIKVCVPTREINEAVQIVLINNGVKWRSRLDGVNHLDRNFLVVDEQGFLGFFGDGRESFEKGNEKEVPYRSILDPFYDVKIAWAGGEVVQYRPLIMGDNGKLSFGDWKDWESNRDICFRSGEHWRIKPKTKTIKQWEYKKTILEGEEVYTVAFRHKALAMDSYRNCGTAITEPTLVEYEVPND